MSRHHEVCYDCPPGPSALPSRAWLRRALRAAGACTQAAPQAPGARPSTPRPQRQERSRSRARSRRAASRSSASPSPVQGRRRDLGPGPEIMCDREGGPHLFGLLQDRGPRPLRRDGPRRRQGGLHGLAGHGGRLPPPHDALRRSAGQLTLEGRLYDVKRKEMVTGKRIKSQVQDARILGHNLSSVILDYLFGAGQLPHEPDPLHLAPGEHRGHLPLRLRRPGPPAPHGHGHPQRHARREPQGRPHRLHLHPEGPAGALPPRPPGPPDQALRPGRGPQLEPPLLPRREDHRLLLLAVGQPRRLDHRRGRQEPHPAHLLVGHRHGPHLVAQRPADRLHLGPLGLPPDLHHGPRRRERPAPQPRRERAVRPALVVPARRQDRLRHLRRTAGSTSPSTT